MIADLWLWNTGAPIFHKSNPCLHGTAVNIPQFNLLNYLILNCLHRFWSLPGYFFTEPAHGSAPH